MPHENCLGEISREAMILFHPKDGLHVRIDPHGSPDFPVVTLCEHSYHYGVVTLRVPENFRSDLASVPWYLRFLFDALGLHQRAALFHDWLYSAHETTRATADAVFRDILEFDGLSKWRVRAMYFGVRLFGKRYWRKKNETKNI
jgi:hypothetical protein